jgi:hypothetical protein
MAIIATLLPYMLQRKKETLERNARASEGRYVRIFKDNFRGIPAQKITPPDPINSLISLNARA